LAPPPHAAKLKCMHPVGVSLQFVPDLLDHVFILFRRNKKKSFIYGIAYGSSQSIVFFAYAVCFSFGAYLVNTKGYAFFYVLR